MRPPRIGVDLRRAGADRAGIAGPGAICTDRMATANITIYTTDPCSFCSRAKGLLEQRGLEYPR